ncbi:MAG: substrate-binding domain-containing protein [Crocosphaera sp.]|nr:substrate-binding domain-containing protein [Crocosphaera sp.]
MYINNLTKKLIQLSFFMGLSLIVVFALFFSQPQKLPISKLNVNPNTSDFNIVLLQHDACPWAYFWCVVEKGINDAANNLNVNVELLRPLRTSDENNEDMIKQYEHLFSELTDHEPLPDAVGITFIDETVSKYLEKLITQEIPTIVYNAGASFNNHVISDLTYLGQNDQQAGYEAGLRLTKQINEKGRAVCINHFPEATNLTARCQGFERAINEAKAKGKTIEYTMLDTQKNDPPAIKEALIKDYTNHPDKAFTIYLSLGPIGAEPFYDFIDDVNLPQDKFAHGIFDLSQEIIDNINKSENTLFAIDQQPYLQGYMIVQLLFWKAKYQLRLRSETKGTNIISTGPNFLKKDELEQVKSLIGQYR